MLFYALPGGKGIQALFQTSRSATQKILKFTLWLFSFIQRYPHLNNSELYSYFKKGFKNQNLLGFIQASVYTAPSLYTFMYSVALVLPQKHYDSVIYYEKDIQWEN